MSQQVADALVKMMLEEDASKVDELRSTAVQYLNKLRPSGLSEQRLRDLVVHSIPQFGDDSWQEMFDLLMGEDTDTHKLTRRWFMRAKLIVNKPEVKTAILMNRNATYIHQ